MATDRPVNPSSKPAEIVVSRAHDNARMLWAILMKSHEMSSIHRDHTASPLHCKTQNLFVGDLLTAETAFLNGDDVMAELPQFPRRRQGKVLICIQVCHSATPRQAASLALICCSISSV